MECQGRLAADSPLLANRWRGLRFDNARFRKELTQANTLYVKVGLLPSFFFQFPTFTSTLERLGPLSAWFYWVLLGFTGFYWVLTMLNAFAMFSFTVNAK